MHMCELMQILVEGPNPRDPLQAMGRTRHNKLAFFPSVIPPSVLKGQLVHMHVEQVRAFTLYGHLVEHVPEQSVDATVVPLLGGLELLAH